MFTEDDLLPLSAVAHFVFCQRRVALLHLENQWVESVATVEGHALHDRAHDSGTENRGDVRIVRGLRLRSLRLGLTGIADVVEFHRTGDDRTGIPVVGAKGCWRPFPVEYKRGMERHELSFEVQLCAQAICLEEMLDVEVPTGALFYGLSKRRHGVTFDQGLRDSTVDVARRLHELFDSGKTPSAVYDKRCRQCSLLELCMPRSAGGGKSATVYLKEATQE